MAVCEDEGKQTRAEHRDEVPVVLPIRPEERSRGWISGDRSAVQTKTGSKGAQMRNDSAVEATIWRRESSLILTPDSGPPWSYIYVDTRDLRYQYTNLVTMQVDALSASDRDSFRRVVRHRLRKPIYIYR